jgi:hypothetical protein
MRRHLPTLLAAVVALFGLLFLVASELVHAVASSNYSWSSELNQNWRKYANELAHPFFLSIFFLPVVAIAVWSRSATTAWTVLGCIVMLFGFDVYVLGVSLVAPDLDRKGCDVCEGSFVLHLIASLIAFVLIAIGVIMRMWKREHV